MKKQYTTEDIKKELGNLQVVKCFSCGKRMAGYLWNAHEKKHLMENSVSLIGNWKFCWLKIS